MSEYVVREEKSENWDSHSESAAWIRGGEEVVTDSISCAPFSSHVHYWFCF